MLAIYEVKVYDIPRRCLHDVFVNYQYYKKLDEKGGTPYIRSFEVSMSCTSTETYAPT